MIPVLEVVPMVPNFCLFTPFPLVLFVFRRKNLVLLQLIENYFCKRVIFEKKGIVEGKFLIYLNYPV